MTLSNTEGPELRIQHTWSGHHSHPGSETRQACTHPRDFEQRRGPGVGDDDEALGLAIHRDVVDGGRAVGV